MNVEGLILDEDNIEFFNAVELVEHTNQIIYLTGKAGTGKTTFLKYIRKTTNKNIVVLAPTGVAAINAGGVTINSFFQIPFGPFVPNDIRLRTTASETENKETIYTNFKYREEKKLIIEKLELLIIDEVSMVRCDTLDVIDKLLRVFRKRPSLPFGGVQVILIGDTFQLAPIADSEQWRILNQFYETTFFFSSKVIESTKPIYIELKKIYRQNEKEFIDLLNKVRVNKINLQDLAILNQKYDPTFTGNGNDYIILATHNSIVNETNLTKLNNLQTESYTFNANKSGVFTRQLAPTEFSLQLKKGAQVMFIKNDQGDHKRYYNGKIGKINELQEDKIVVIFDNNKKVLVERSIWHNIKYTYNKEKKKVEKEVIGTFEQFPLKLAWAVTVHKSQGLTFEKVIADLGKAFAEGQVYVALSRCTSYNGLVLKTKLHQSAIKTNQKVIEFAKNETPSTLIVDELNRGKADYYYKKARTFLNSGNFKESWKNLLQAIEFRNDIKTKLFEKYFLITVKRLFSFKIKNDSISDMYAKLESENKELEHKNLFSTKELEETKQKLILDEQKLKILVSQIQTIEHKNDNYTKEIKKQKLNLERTEIKLEDLNEEYKKEIVKISNLQTTIGTLSAQNEQLKLEIIRLNKIKWYQKLFGTN